jgi:hypothetical protein
MVLMNGLWSGRIWINLKNGEGKGGWKYDISESQQGVKGGITHVYQFNPFSKTCQLYMNFPIF